MAQTAYFRPAPVTQRDGSPLASSNCRMASAAVGVSYETGPGGVTSTGAKMRSFCDDQEGGTDSGDAKQSWSRGYGQTLTIRDGGSWDGVMADLAAGRLVHLDVWAAACGGPVCQSGSGAYGHTIAVLPDQDQDGWLVSDPWCSPPKWSRVSTARLREGAEEWGRRVFGSTGGATDPEAVRAAVKRLMTRSRPGLIRALPRPRDTSGAPRVLWTVTAPHTAEDAQMGETFLTSAAKRGVATVHTEVGLIPTAGGPYQTIAAGTTRNVSDVVTITSGRYAGTPAYLVKLPDHDATALLLASYASFVPEPAAGGDTAARDAQWEDALRRGEPWPTT